VSFASKGAKIWETLAVCYSTDFYSSTVTPLPFKRQYSAKGQKKQITMANTG